MSTDNQNSEEIITKKQIKEYWQVILITATVVGGFGLSNYKADLTAYKTDVLSQKIDALLAMRTAGIKTMEEYKKTNDERLGMCCSTAQAASTAITAHLSK